MFVAIWEYEVRAGCEAAFEALYGRDGAWAALLHEYPGHLDTELLRHADNGRYVTLDRWESAAGYQSFLTAAQSRYALLDEQGDALTITERRVGLFEAQ